MLWRNTTIIQQFLLAQKGLDFLRNDSDCKDVDLYNTRKRYAVIESLDLTRIISWLASCFSKIKKPNKHCSGNQSVIAGVCISDTISHIYCQVIFWFELQLVDLRGTREIQNRKKQSKEGLGLMKYTHWLSEYNKVTK